MNKKACNQCNKEKKMSEFSWRNKKARKKLETCKECYSEYRRNYYILNKEAEKQRVYKRRSEAETKIAKYLQSHFCVDCGEEDPVVLQFDHVRGIKKYAVSIMVRDCHDWKNVSEEIEKCDVRCANCHTRKTTKDFRWRKLTK